MPRVYPTFEQKFWSKVSRTEDDSCWDWKGSKNSEGYGRFRVGKHNCYAHRVSFEAFIGPIVDGMVIDHLCENKSCVNPEHLEPVTQAENAQRSAALAAIF